MVNPFNTTQGAFRREMYVGRDNYIKSLLHENKYASIYSGRRLGKTVLMRSVEDRATDQLLKKVPLLSSGNSLFVLYKSLAGIYQEEVIVDEILTALKDLQQACQDKAQKFVLPTLEWTEGCDPLKYFRDYMTTLLEINDKSSFLILLDEADRFFEDQLQKHETSLSWTMRDLEEKRDSSQLKRLRFVVCGYRETYRLEGAWGHWGDVLELKPLSPKDAVTLICGPLANMGWDVQKVAVDIACCGYQPALILKFCRNWLIH